MVQKSKKGKTRLRVPASCVAEYATSSDRSAESIIRPYKVKRSAEHVVRSSYYQRMLKTVRNHLASENDPIVIDTEIEKLRREAEASEDARLSTKLERNASALEAYRSVYGGRRFELLPCHRISFPIAGVDFTAQPDIWAREGNTEVLIKIGVSRKRAAYIDILLTVMRKAAIASGYRTIRAKNVVYLNISTGQEVICRSGLTRFNLTFASIARTLAIEWQRTPVTTDSQQNASKRTAP